jgi:hypothetical protein
VYFILLYTKHAFVGFGKISKEHMLSTSLSISVILNNADKIYRVSANQSDAKNFILTLIYSSHMGSRWYTSHFSVVIIGFKHLPQYGDQDLYCGTAEIGVNVRSQEATACFSLTSVTYC